MGGAVSAGRNNNELVDNLVKYQYVHTIIVERVLRAVDRGDYMMEEYRRCAYRDQAWRHRHYHLSAPCIYSAVLEGLKLRPGLSFLNLGSGTGYLNTMVGLILGSNGINHGVEYYEDVIKYAHNKLENFKKYSGAIDEFDFCEPHFMQGNCLKLKGTRKYDRIYVGASCPNSYYGFLKTFLKVGGIMVMPFRDSLMQIERISETSYSENPLIAVTFAMLILPKPEEQSMELDNYQPMSLQDMCRIKIRNTMREKISKEDPEIMYNRSEIFDYLKISEKIYDKHLAAFQFESIGKCPDRGETDVYPKVKKLRRCDDVDTRRRVSEDSERRDYALSGMDKMENPKEDLKSESSLVSSEWNANRIEQSEDIDDVMLDFQAEEDDLYATHSPDQLEACGENSSQENVNPSVVTEQQSEEQELSTVWMPTRSPYTPLMIEKINDLPLPRVLKGFLNCNRS